MARSGVIKRGGLVGPPCSRNPHDEAVVVRRAQLGTKPGHPLKEGNEQAWKDHLWLVAAAALDGHFEHPANRACAITTLTFSISFLDLNA